MCCSERLTKVFQSQIQAFRRDKASVLQLIIQTATSELVYVRMKIVI